MSKRSPPICQSGAATARITKWSELIRPLMGQASLRNPTKPDTISNMKPDTFSDLKPDSVPI
jgi:hypothetical protein